MAKIFMAFFNGVAIPNNNYVMPCFYESFIMELKKLGNDVVYSFHDNFGYPFNEPASPQFIQDLKNFNPDLIILFNNKFHDLSADFDCPIVVYEVDSFLYYANKQKLKNNPDRYKFMVPQLDSINILNEELGVKKENICYVPFFTSINAEEIPQTTNISFIGSKFDAFYTDSAYTLFMKTAPSEQEISQFKQVEECIKADPYISKEKIIEKLSLTSGKVINNLYIENIIMIVSNKRRIQTLSQIVDLGLDLYGTPNWATDLIYEPDLTLSYKNKKVYSIKHNQDIYNGSKICININHLQATTGFSWRVCDIMASNGCLVSEYKPDIDRLFPNVPIPTFNNRYEARELCIKLLNDENMRKDIVAQCQEVIDKKYRFSHLLKSMEDFLGINLHNNLIKDAPLSLIAE